MFSFKPAWWPAILASLTTAAACAQAVEPAAPGVAAVSAASSISYASPLKGYQPFRDEKIQPWKESNDTVGRIGGWRAYAREAAGSAPPATAAPTPDGAPHPHAGHGRH